LALEELVYSVEFTNVSEPPPDLRIKYHTDEERHRARIEQQMRWNARNPDKVNEYRRKYEAKPERRERARQAWHNRTPEEKQMIQQRQQERRLLKKQEQDNEHKGT
jgi:hypothetical protein